MESGDVDETSTTDDEDNVVLNDLVARIQGHNDLLLQSFDDFVACDNNLEMCDNTITNLKTGAFFCFFCFSAFQKSTSLLSGRLFSAVVMQWFRQLRKNLKTSAGGMNTLSCKTRSQLSDNEDKLPKENE